MSSKAEAKPAGSPGTTPKDTPQPLDTQIEIGNSSYIFSEETRRYLFPVKLADFDTLWLDMPSGQSRCPDYEKTRSVLVVSDPHFLATAQFRLYQGLEVFFRDNPGLAQRTVFLAEGFPANQSISVQSLVNVDPNPSDKLVRKVLESYLIPGYVAYEWKHQEGIPIIGIEDQPLYKLSRDYRLGETSKKIFFSSPVPEMEGILKKKEPQLWEDIAKILRDPSLRGTTTTIGSDISIRLSEEAIWSITYGMVQGFLVQARDRRMAQTLIEKSRKFENPMIFMGQDHLYDAQGSWTFDLVRSLILKSGPQGPLGAEAWALCKDLEDKGIYDYLQDEKIGFTFIDPEKLGDVPGDHETYFRLYQAQQETGRYGEYVHKLLQSSKKEVTIRPSPEVASDYVRKLKALDEDRETNVVYERKEEEEERPHWVKVSHDEVWDAVVKDSIWHQPITYQGRDFEQVRNVNLGSNCPHIDDIVVDAMTVTQHKSMDLTLKTYQNVGGIDSTVSGYIDHLDETTRGTWSWTDKKSDEKYVFERGRNFQDRYLELGIPAGKATQAQIEKLLELQDYAQTKDVTLVIVEVP